MITIKSPLYLIMYQFMKMNGGLEILVHLFSMLDIDESMLSLTLRPLESQEDFHNECWLITKNSAL